MTETSYSEYMSGEEHNLPYFGGFPEIRYAVIGSPRTGTNLLCDYLSQLGLGVPMEYFSRWTIEDLPNRLGSLNPSEYGSDLLSNRTSAFDDESVFGVKALWPYEWQRIQTFIWPNRIIRMFREEKEDQVLSYARARITGTWAVMGDDELPTYDEAPEPEDLVDAENVIMKLEQFWNQAAESNAAFSYEYLRDKPVDALRHIVDEVFELSVEVPDDITPRTRKLT